MTNGRITGPCLPTFSSSKNTAFRSGSNGRPLNGHARPVVLLLIGTRRTALVERACVRGSCQPNNRMQRTALYAAAGAERQGHRNRDRGRGFRDRCTMTMGHEKLDFYRLSIGYVAWVYEKAEGANGVQPPTRDSWLRGRQSIPLNIAEVGGKTELYRMAAMFNRLDGRGYQVREEQDVYGAGFDPDSDFDLEGKDEQPQPSVAGYS